MKNETKRKETGNEIDAESRNEIQELFQELFVGQITRNMEAMKKELKDTAECCESLQENLEQQVNQLREMDDHTLMLENSLDEKLEEKLGEKMTGFADSVNSCLTKLFDGVASLEKLLNEQKETMEGQAVLKLNVLTDGVKDCQSSLDLVTKEVSGCRSNLNILTEKIETVQEIKRCLEELGKQLNYSKSQYGDMVQTVQNIQNDLKRLDGEWKEEGRLTREAMAAEHKKNMRGLWLAVGGLFLCNILLLVLTFIR